MLLEINGHNENVVDLSDFSYLIEKYLGADARSFFDELIEEYDSELHYCYDIIENMGGEGEL